MEIEISKIQIRVDLNLTPRSAEKLRGFLGRLFREIPHIHNHDVEGNLIYQYPRVQYKVLNNSFLIIGFMEGKEIINKLFYDLNTLNLEGSWEQVVEHAIDNCKFNFGLSSQSYKYRFITPWLALNEMNYERYQKFGIFAKRKELLENILIGNLISISKSLGYTVPAKICSNIVNTREVKIKFKNILMIGFLGEFSVNFEIPDYFGIGKSVSRGFGTIIRVQQ